MNKCYLCGSKELKEIQSKIRNNHSDETKVYECLFCGVHFLFPFPSEADISNYYQKEYRKEYEGENCYSKEESDEFFEKSIPEAKQRVDRIKGYLKKNDEILEIGCASGYFLEMIKSFVKKANGLEWDYKNAEYAQKLGFEVKSNPEEFNKKFNKIFMFHVLEHIVNPIEYMKNLKNYIEKDGMVFIEVPNNQDILISRYDIPKFREFYYCSAHLWYFNAKSLEMLLNKAGYDCEIVQIQRYDISNHMEWLSSGIPGGQGKYNDVFTADLKKSYNEMLSKNQMTDTIYAICKVKTN